MSQVFAIFYGSSFCPMWQAVGDWAVSVVIRGGLYRKEQPGIVGMCRCIPVFLHLDNSPIRTFLKLYASAHPVLTLP